MKRQKEYSTLKVQQEIIKTYFKGETHCNFYVSALGKPGIVAVRTEEGMLVAGIMEVK